jgi:hypothetical protein
MSTQISDVRFAECLLQMVRADVERAVAEPRSPVRRAVALWMTHELTGNARTLRIPREHAHELMKEAEQLRRRVLGAAGMQRFSEDAAEDRKAPRTRIAARA